MFYQRPTSALSISVRLLVTHFWQFHQSYTQVLHTSTKLFEGKIRHVIIFHRVFFIFFNRWLEMREKLDFADNLLMIS